MTYVLVSLVNGDEATQDSDLLATALEESTPPHSTHRGPVLDHEPDSRFSDRPEFGQIQSCFLAMVRAFLDGCDVQGMLMVAGYEAHDLLKNGIGFTVDSPGAAFWPESVSMQKLVESVRVLTTGAEAPIAEPVP